MSTFVPFAPKTQSAKIPSRGTCGEPSRTKRPSFDPSTGSALRTGFTKGGVWVPSFAREKTGGISQRVPQCTNVMWFD